MKTTMRKNKTLWLLLMLLSFSTMPSSVLGGGKDDPVIAKVMIDQLEIRGLDTDKEYVLEAQGWLGKDLDKLWLKTEVERNERETEEAEVQLLYSQGVSPFWDFQFGLKNDFLPKPDNLWVVMGFQGLSPYFLEVDTALFIGERGMIGLRLEAEYELMITQRFLISPEIELNLYNKNNERQGIGSGLANIETGLRFRYELRREFAPYIGVNWAGSFGNAANFANAEGESTRNTKFVLGVNAWF
jgi:copper resistance protein B